jgi:apolipoprotein N-acyltransferase
MTAVRPETQDDVAERRSSASRGSRARDMAIVFARCVLAGLTIVLAIPPFGWWPLAFLGIFQWDRLIAEQSWRRRFRRSWLIAAAWFFPSMLWMLDLTPPGYVIACGAYAAFVAVLIALVPPHAIARWIALPGAIVIAELWRWSWPFEGVPLATLAMSQAAAPLGQTARIGNAILVSGLVAVGGVALSALYERRIRFASIAGAVVLAFYLLSLVAPRGHDTQPLRVAVVQGGGIQRTGTGRTESDAVFQRHLQASELIKTPVDVVVWPENVVEVSGRLPGTKEDRQLQALAMRLNAPVIVGATEGNDDSTFLNAAVVYLPDGERGERFDKVTRVPFGEWVPFRSLIEKLAPDSGIPARDAVPGTGPAVLHTPAGTLGVAISWEIFFTDRTADGVKNGAEVLINPTNGSSYWLNEVQTQQLATSRLRAIETGRWELQSAPTGFSAIFTPDGTLIDCDVTTPSPTLGAAAGTAEASASGVTEHRLCRSDNSAEDHVSGQAVLQATVMKRDGRTIATTVGVWPTFIAAIAAMVIAWVLDKRRKPMLPIRS